MNRARPRPPVLVVALAAVTVAFLVLPLAGILERAAWSGLWDDLTSERARDAIRLSIVCSLAAAILSVLLGTPLAWILARTEIPGRPLIRGLVLLPMVLPPVVGGVALLSAFSLRSPVGGWLHDTFGIQLTFSTAGAVVAETFVALPFFVITVEAGLRTMDQRFEGVAASLGAGRFTVFRRVTLPLIAPSVAAGTVLAWARALGEFGATITFAGNLAGRTQTLPLAVYLQLGTDRDAAVSLSLVLLAVSLVVLVALRDRWLVRA
jgi:molybdate transport system permease protein